jgi:hypothetical protein
MQKKKKKELLNPWSLPCANEIYVLIHFCVFLFCYKSLICERRKVEKGNPSSFTGVWEQELKRR